MKTQNTVPLQPKWICAAAIGALTVGVIVGANAQNATGDLPAPPKLPAPMPPLDGPDEHGPRGEDGPPRRGPRERGNRMDEDQRDDRGPRGGGPRDQKGPRGERDEMGPPEGGPAGRGPRGFGPDGDRGPEDREFGARGPKGGGPNERGSGPRGPEGRGIGKGGLEGRGPEGREPEGRRPGPRGPRAENANTAESAQRALERSYRDAGQADAMGKLDGEAFNLLGQARDYYSRALESYGVKNYDKAGTFADVSSHLSHAALSAKQNAVLRAPAGWPAPPTGATAPKDRDQDRSAMALDRAYRELGRPLEGKDATAQRWLETARQLYKTASVDYGAKRFDSAEGRARAADEVVKAARRLGDASEL